MAALLAHLEKWFPSLKLTEKLGVEDNSYQDVIDYLGLKGLNFKLLQLNA